jgi:membrane protein implicated in regulation of membrane protease activity
MIWLLLLLILLIATGALWLVVKIALGIALGLFLGFLAIAAFVWWRVRRALREDRSRRGPGSGSSEVTVLYHED